MSIFAITRTLAPDSQAGGVPASGIDLVARERLFAPDVVQTFRLPDPRMLGSQYAGPRFTSTGRELDFSRLLELGEQLKAAAQTWSRARYEVDFAGSKMAPDVAEAARIFLREQPSFKSICRELEIAPEHERLITLPWWLEVAASEREFSGASTGCVATLEARHSYETQLVRQGIERPIKSASAMALVLTKSARGEGSFVVLGLRAGKVLPDTYHLPAGALRLTTDLKEGKASVYDALLEFEVTRELGLKLEHIEQAGFFFENIRCRY